MTKHNKDQPRDGNGKFAKMIKVTDKYGNAAYFTPEEMRGFKLSEKNPDCEPATKAYSKYIGRTIIKESGHSHFISSDNDLRTNLLIVFGLSTLSFGFAWFLLGTSLNNPSMVATMLNIELAKTLLSISGPVSIISALITICAFATGDQPMRTDVSKINYEGGIPKSICAYTPPRRDECEEE